MIHLEKSIEITIRDTDFSLRFVRPGRFGLNRLGLLKDSSQRKLRGARRIVDEDGRLVHESRVGSDPALIASELQRIGDGFARVGFEAGPLSQWMFFGLMQAVCIVARHAKAAMVAMNRNKNDRNDARSIAHLIRSGWFKAVHVKSVASQEQRSLPIAREFFVNKLRDHENEIRGLLRPFGLKVGRVSASGFDARVRDLVDGNPQLELCIGALLDGRAAMMARLCG